MPANDEPILILEVSRSRSWFGICTMALLGLLLGWIALMAPPREPGWLLILILIGGSALWWAWHMKRASEDALILTETEVKSRSGAVVCRIEDVASVERGLFAFKPSGGFLIRLKTPAPRAWVPGLWWRIGRRVGIGGVTRAGDARAMADVIEALRSGLNQS